MSALKEEIISILPKSSNTEISLSKMDQVFMIILLRNLKPDFKNIREQILTGAVIPNFDEALTRLLRHTSTTTQSMRSKITSNTSVMVSQSHSRSDSRGGCGSNRGRGQHPQCTSFFLSIKSKFIKKTKSRDRKQKNPRVHGSCTKRNLSTYSKENKTHQTTSSMYILS